MSYHPHIFFKNHQIFATSVASLSVALGAPDGGQVNGFRLFGVTERFGQNPGCVAVVQ